MFNKQRKKMTKKQEEIQDEEVIKDEKDTKSKKKTKSSKKDKLTDRIKELEQELSESKDKFLRLFAEFDNFKKRTAKERIDFRATAGMDALQAFLPVMDDFDRAKKVAENEDNNEEFSEGVKLVYQKLKSVLTSKGIKVKVQKVPFIISYFYKEKEVTSEKIGYSKDTVHEKIELNLTSDEILYGTGARALGMNRRGNRLKLYNRAHYGYETHSELMNFTMPIVISSKKYMVHFDNAPIGYLDLDSKKDNSLTYETISGRKTYQVIVGDSWEDLIDNYTQLTGKQPLPPRWVLGNFSSRFGYHSQKETTETITKFKEEEIPVDAVILDLFWFGKDIKGTMGNLEVHKDSFPDMKGMISTLKNKGT